MDPLSPTDQELIARARTGDRQAFGVLVQRHEARVRGTVQGMLGYTQEVDDVAQEVFIRLFQRLGQFRGDAKLSTYLGRIAINLSLNALQKRKRRRWFSLGSDTDNGLVHDPVDTSNDPRRLELRDSLQRALARLDPDFRAVVVLRLVEGYSVQETADILGVPMGTVGSRLTRAQKQLREWLRPIYD